MSKKWDPKAATMFPTSVIAVHGKPPEITAKRAHTLVQVISELLPNALHDATQQANNRVDADHGCLKVRLRQMRDLKLDRTATAVIRGHASIENARWGPYKLGMDAH